MKLNFVVGVLRENIANHGTAARAERQFVEVLLLREVHWNQDGLTARGTNRASDRQAADFPRRRQVSLEQCRRELSHRNIVKTKAGIVAGQKLPDIDWKPEKVA